MNDKEYKDDEKSEKLDIIMEIVCFFMKMMVPIIAVIILIAFGVSAFKFLQEESRKDKELSEQVTTSKYDVVSIDFQSQTEGKYRHFIIGTGQIKSKEYYVIYKVLPDGGKILVKLESDSTVIYDTLEENETAYVENDINGHGYTVATRLYVPKNTIKQEYDLSLGDDNG